MPRKRPKSLDAPVTNQVKRLEAWAYLRCDQWKRSYRYTLVNEFRIHITAAKNAIIRGLELQSRYREEKVYHFRSAFAELSIVESNMDIMIMDSFCIMSEKEWSQAAQQIDDIRIGLSRLVNSLTHNVGESELPNLGTEGDSFDHKDA
jgi:hypothetical protein